MDPPKSREPLYSGQLTCPRLILQYISDTFQLQTMDTDQPPTYLSQYKITSENGQWSYTHMMQTLSTAFVKDWALY